MNYNLVKPKIMEKKSLQYQKRILIAGDGIAMISPMGYEREGVKCES